MTTGLSIVFTREAVVDETHIRKSTKVCKWIAGIDASQLHSFSGPMPTGVSTKNEFDADLQRFKPRQNNSRSFEKVFISYFQRIRRTCRTESFYTTRSQKKIDCFNADGFCGHCNTVVERIVCFYL